ncbi:Biogenesis of lysosome-related organelles complex 1 subunit 1 [Apodemus speciosus]|uniref:Biogenesis of lysosome-related organelles complex 1 subunit 1 n=1 Tax=Apodemus speciosus TaxID=105296 RepID=A0ABQ0F916_APOSI
MLSRLLKEHQAKQNERKELQGELAQCPVGRSRPRPSFFRKPGPRKRRREAITAATCLTEALVDHLNVGPVEEVKSAGAGWRTLVMVTKASTSTELERSLLPQGYPPRLTFPAPSQLQKLLERIGNDVAQAYMNQRKLDHEVKTLQVQAAQFAKQTGQWIGMVENFNQALKEIGDVENWARSIELDMRTIATALEYVYKGQLQSAPS